MVTQRVDAQKRQDSLLPLRLHGVDWFGFRNSHGAVMETLQVF